MTLEFIQSYQVIKYRTKVDFICGGTKSCKVFTTGIYFDKMMISGFWVC